MGLCCEENANFFVGWHPTVANPFSLGFNFNYGDMTMSQLAGHGYC